GTTPYAELHTFDLEAGGTMREFRVHLEGHHDETVSLDVSQGKIVENVDLRRVRRARSAAVGKPAAAPAATAVRVDGVATSAAEAARAVAFINQADEAALRAAGIAGRQVNIILDKRPFADLAAFGSTPFIGRKTVEAVVSAVR
ncbi:MAG: hypothetical protein VX000_05770, partial [Myxococcota bacterium]|nr:hypothetical protein [Myxococcota bacterium]